MKLNNPQSLATQIAKANTSLQALKAAPAEQLLPASVQANLLRAFNAQKDAPSEVVAVGANVAAQKIKYLAPLLAIAVAIAGAVGMLTAKQQNSDSLQSQIGWESPSHGDLLRGKIGHLQAPFIALKDLNLIALELNTTIVETQLSPLQLVRLGVPVNPSNTANVVAAQVLMSESGEPLAFKLD